MKEDQLRSELVAHFGAMYLAAAAVDVTPDLQPEEKRFLDYWIKEQQKKEPA